MKTQPTAAPNGPDGPMPERLRLRGDEPALYRAHQPRLRATTRRALDAPEELIEDACQFAWLQLCRRQPERGRSLLAWLRTTAVREGLRLIARERRYPRALCAVATDAAAVREPVDPDQTPGPFDVDRAIEARGALSALAGLPGRQREYVGLRVAGYSYNEIVELTGRTYTNVNKHLVRGRAALRRAA